MWTTMMLVFLAATDATPGAGLWQALAPLCGQAFEGRMTHGTEPSDKDFAQQRMVAHVASCDADEIRIPFHVGDDRSRTWVLTRTPSGVRLKHDHRHPDGSEDSITQYGGDTRQIADPLSLDFHADEWTAKLIPAAASNVWTMAIKPGEYLAYALRREEQGRHFRVEFDLSRPVEAPPPAWGGEQ